jgi:adenylylsulfate kinase
MGSGKTAVAIALGDLLQQREQPYALVDLDWLGWVDPAPFSLLTQRAVLAENLRLIWPTFREAGVERLVLARYVEDREQLDEFRAALPGVELAIVRLVAPAPLIELRLRARDTGAQLEEHLAETAEFAARAEANALEDAVVDNGDRSLAEVAAEVLNVVGW